LVQAPVIHAQSWRVSNRRLRLRLIGSTKMTHPELILRGGLFLRPKWTLIHAEKRRFFFFITSAKSVFTSVQISIRVDSVC
ncbi:MAG: hypothetical protein ABIU06_17735, partial [Anaerolineales bacterium]